MPRTISIYIVMHHVMHGFFTPRNSSGKALTVLSGNYFNPTHGASQTDIKKISNEILSNDDKIRICDVLSKFLDIRRDLARYGYYEKEGATKSPSDVFNKDNTENSLKEISFLINKLREIHYYQIFEPPIKIGILSGYISARNEKPCSYYLHSGYRKAVQWMLDLNNIKHGDSRSKLFHASSLYKCAVLVKMCFADCL